MERLRLEELLPERQTEVILRPESRSWILAMLVGILFMAAGFWLSLKGNWAGWVCAGLASLTIPCGIFQVMPGMSYLQLTREGFTMRCLFRPRSHRWDEVEEFFVVKMKQFGFITVQTLVGFNYSAAYGKEAGARNLAHAISGAEAALPDT